MKTCVHSHNFESVLAERGLRPTHKRLLVLDALHTHGTLSAEALAALPELSRMDRVTVYRALQHLCAAGVVYETADTRSGARYRLTAHHTHLVQCTVCKRTESVSECDPALIKKLGARQKLLSVIDAHALTFFGVCNACVHKNRG